MQKDRRILARRPDLVLISKKKRTYHLVDFDIPTDNRGKNKRKRKDKRISGSCLRVEKAVEYEGDNELLLKSSESGKETVRTDDQRKNRDHQANSIVAIRKTKGNLLSLRLQWKNTN